MIIKENHESEAVYDINFLRLPVSLFGRMKFYDGYIIEMHFFCVVILLRIYVLQLIITVPMVTYENKSLHTLPIRVVNIYRSVEKQMLDKPFPLSIINALRGEANNSDTVFMFYSLCTLKNCTTSMLLIFPFF